MPGNKKDDTGGGILQEVSSFLPIMISDGRSVANTADFRLEDVFFYYGNIDVEH